jgi:predicted nucleic-acid-binding Zn-ribbon protein
MKHNLKCPKCGSSDIIADARALGSDSFNALQDLSVATYRHPGALIFKGQQTSTLSAWVCGGCGFVELYADNPAALRSEDEQP